LTGVLLRQRLRWKGIDVTRIRAAVSATVFITLIGLQSNGLEAQRNRRDRNEDRRDRLEDRLDRREDRLDRWEDQLDRREDRLDRWEDRRDFGRPYDTRWRNYDYRRFEPGQNRYDAARYYRRDDNRYRVRRLGRNDRIYRGYDNRYYCRRDDGTTGLIVGGMAGGVLGHIIAPGGSKTLGTIIGAGAGALLGRQVDRGDVVCR
jgi:hypothetical protein